MTKPAARPPAEDVEVRPRRRRSPYVALALVLAVAVGLGAWQGWFAPSDGTPGGDFKPPDRPLPVDLDRLPELRWHALLGRPPREMSLPRGKGTSVWNHAPELRQLTVWNTGLGLLELGVTEAPHHVFRVGLNQTRWPGGIGAYIGCRAMEGGAGRVQHFLLREQRMRSGGRQLSLVRGFHDLKWSEDGWRAGPVTDVASHPLRELRGELTLEITVAKNALRRVRVNGVEMTELVTPEAAKAFTPADHAGGLGLLVSGGDGVFREADFMRLTEAP